MAGGDRRPLGNGSFRLNRDDGIGEGPPLRPIDRAGRHPQDEGLNGRVTCIGEGAGGGRVGVVAIDDAEIAISSSSRNASLVVI